ncbi:MAG: response regulator transcription factor [bacterium]
MKANAQPRTTKRKVLIVDDHPLLREGLRKVIDQQEDFVVCGEAGDAPGGLAAAEKCLPDIAIVDISLEEGSGLALIKDIHTRQPQLPLLALSMHHEDLYADRALRAGARGYVMKREPASAVLEAMRKVLNGQTAFSDSVINRLVGRRIRGEQPTAHSPMELLSDREIEIYRCLGEGHGTREISVKLRIAVSTVESYRASIKQKLDLKHATELVSSATRFVTAESKA